MCKVGRLRFRAGSQSPAHANQIPHLHICGQRVASRLGDFALYIHRCRFHRIRVAMDQQTVARLHQNVFCWIACQCLLQIHAEYFEFAVRQVTKYLGVFSLCVGSESTRKMHGID